MRDLIVTENITLDGVIEADDRFSPAGAADVDMSDLEDALRDQREQADAFLVGRVTFEEMRGFWPNRTDDSTGVSEYLDRVAKYVVSSELDDPQWANSTVLRGDVVDEVTALKTAAGADIVTTGSVTLVHDLVANELVDEFRLFVYPVVVGEGRRLFEGRSAAGDLDLIEASPFRSGVVLLRYRTAR